MSNINLAQPNTNLPADHHVTGRRFYLARIKKRTTRRASVADIHGDTTWQGLQPSWVHAQSGEEFVFRGNGVETYVQWERKQREELRRKRQKEYAQRTNPHWFDSDGGFIG